MDFTKTLYLRRKRRPALPGFRKLPWQKQKPIFRGGFAFLHSLLSQAGPQTYALKNQSYRKSLEALLPRSIEFEFLQKQRRHPELRNDTFLQVSVWAQSWHWEDGARKEQRHSQEEELARRRLNDDVRQCGDKASFGPKGLTIPPRLALGCQPAMLCSVACPHDLSLRGGSAPCRLIAKTNSNVFHWSLLRNTPKSLLLQTAHDEMADPPWRSFHSKCVWLKATSIVNVASSDLRKALRPCWTTFPTALRNGSAWPLPVRRSSLP